MTEEIKKLIIYTRKMKKREPLYRDYPEEFRPRFGLLFVLLTLGPDGCDLYADSGRIHSPAVPVKVVSTVGAGDSFSAAFLYHYLTGSSLADALAAGNRLAAKIAGQKGAI